MVDSIKNAKDYQKMMKQGKDELKTSFFSFKFSPDYLSAVGYFTEAGRGFRKLKMYQESIAAFLEAIQCNAKLNENWAEGQNLHEIADMHIFDLDSFQNGWEYLQKSSMAFKIAGKFTSGIKIYTDTAQKLMEINRYGDALVILMQAFEECKDHTHDQLIRISLDDVFSKLLDVLCGVEKYTDAIEYIEKYIKIQLSISDESKYKISKNYLKLGILRIIVDEMYMVDKILDDMILVYDSSCNEDMDDLRKLVNSFKTRNKKDFTYCITCAFSLFQNNLLKGLKKAYESKEQEGGMMPPQNSTQINPNLQTGHIILSENFDNLSIDSAGVDTKANSVAEGESSHLIGASQNLNPVGASSSSANVVISSSNRQVPPESFL